MASAAAHGGSRLDTLEEPQDERFAFLDTMLTASTESAAPTETLRRARALQMRASLRRHRAHALNKAPGTQTKEPSESKVGAEDSFRAQMRAAVEDARAAAHLLEGLEEGLDETAAAHCLLALLGTSLLNSE